MNNNLNDENSEVFNLSFEEKQHFYSLTYEQNRMVGIYLGVESSFLPLLKEGDPRKLLTKLFEFGDNPEYCVDIYLKERFQ